MEAKTLSNLGQNSQELTFALIYKGFSETERIITCLRTTAILRVQLARKLCALSHALAQSPLSCKRAVAVQTHMPRAKISLM